VPLIYSKENKNNVTVKTGYELCQSVLNYIGIRIPKNAPISRIQVKLLKPDLAIALTWWSLAFPSSKQNVVGNSTMNLQKFNDGWKIVASHTSIAQM
jgi:hypothetical protein